MKLLFHAFPRLRHSISPDQRISWTKPTEADRDAGIEILGHILNHGLLCTPERFNLWADPATEREEKLQLLERDQPYGTIVQSRACFTLMEYHELAEAHDSAGTTGPISHSGIFGEFALGLDPVEAREVGVLPAIYYYPSHHSIPVDGRLRDIAGLGSQIVHRLDELRTLAIILSHLEWKAARPGLPILSPETLAQLGAPLAYEPAVAKRLESLSQRDARKMLELFDTDRVAGWNLVDFLKMMLSLYQTTDSTLVHAPLAFFQQREWRLTHHMREGLTWFGLGQHQADRDPDAAQFADEKAELIRFMRKRWRGTPESLAKHLQESWVLSHVGGLHFRELVREIIVPPERVAQVEHLLDDLDFLERPVVRALPPIWQIDTNRGEPTIRPMAT